MRKTARSSKAFRPCYFLEVQTNFRECTENLTKTLACCISNMYDKIHAGAKKNGAATRERGGLASYVMAIPVR